MGIREPRTRLRFKVEVLQPTISSMLRLQLLSRSQEVTSCNIPRPPPTLLLTPIPPRIPTPTQLLHRGTYRVRPQIRVSMGIQHRFNRSSTPPTNPLPGLCSISIPKRPRLQPSIRLCSSIVPRQPLNHRPTGANPLERHRSKRVLSSLLRRQPAMLLRHLSEHLMLWYQLRA
jgi:hypothetical protein